MLEYTFSTKLMSYTFDEQGKVQGFIQRSSGKNIASPGSLAFYLLPGVQQNPYPKPVLPKTVKCMGNEVTVHFQQVRFTLLVQSFEDHLRINVIDQQPLGVDYGRFVFGACELQEDDEFCGSAVSLHLRCNLLEMTGRTRHLGAIAYSKLGAVGVSAAIIGTKFGDLREAVKHAIAHLTIDDIPMSPYGGPYGADAPGSRDDYVLAGSAPDISDQRWLEPILKAGVRQVDFHHGYLYRHADYLFDPVLFPNGVLDFKRRVTDVLHENGCLAGLHTYSGMVDVRSTFVSPVPDPDLYSFAEYTLAEDIDANAVSLKIEENASEVPLTQPIHTTKDVTCLLVGHEIIAFSGSDGRHTLTGCQRGHLGTSAHGHKKGEKLRHLRSMYNLFQCKPGSALFYKLAKNKAQTYNEGGFDMMYFDGLECIGDCCTGELEGLGWYYEALFVRETLRHCIRTPLVEYSTIHPLVWTARSRAGAFDYPTSAYKRFIDLHCTDNEANAHRRLLPSQLGWLQLYPAATPINQPGDNWMTKYSYSDDIDYIGTKSVAYGSGLSYMLTSPDQYLKYPILDAYYEKIALYSRLRSERYFSTEVCDRLKGLREGWRLIEQDGKYGFEQLTRLHVQPYQLGEKAVVNNPFHAQQPMIRIEAQSAAKEDSGITIWTFDENETLSVPLVKDYPNFLDLTGHEALVLTLESDGVCGKLNIRLEARAPRSNGHADHVIDLGFCGIRNYMLCERDNGEWDDLPWQGGTGSEKDYYSRYSNPMYYDGIGSIRILRSGGGDVRLRTLTGHPIDRSPLINPSVTIGTDTISFACELKPGEYLEYYPGDYDAVLYDVHGKKDTISVEGSVGVLPKGESSVEIGGTASGNRRAKLHLLVTGERIFNP